MSEVPIYAHPRPDRLPRRNLRGDQDPQRTIGPAGFFPLKDPEGKGADNGFTDGRGTHSL